MRKSRVNQFLGVISVFLLTFFIIPICHGRISSWIDENGVRHFSNVETSDENKNSESKSGESIEEYMTNETDEEVERSRDRFKILEMYEQDRLKKEKQEALEEEMKAAEKKEREQREAEDRAARKRREACEEHQMRLNDLRHSKWEDYDTPELSLITCPDRRWKGARGKVYDNIQECTERRDKAIKSAYEQAVLQLEERVNALCAQ